MVVTTRVAVDAMGGDHAPRAVVAGAMKSVLPGMLEVILCGPPDELSPLLPDPLPDGVTTMSSAGAAAGLPARSGPQSSIATACDLVRRHVADAVVSAGATGPTVATASLTLPRIAGVLRPALAVLLPVRLPIVLIDAGAVPDANAEMLVQFGVLGSSYAAVRLGRGRPRVALLNIGTEKEKGNKVSRAAHAGLRHAPVDFVGNIEGGDLLNGVADVVVTDGFTGNIVLKLIEAELGIGPDAESADVEGAAALVGLDATVLVTHGAARATTIAAACRMAHDLVTANVTAAISSRLAEGW